MDDLLIHGLQDMYYAEIQIVKSLPKLIENFVVALIAFGGWEILNSNAVRFLLPRWLRH